MRCVNDIKLGIPCSKLKEFIKDVKIHCTSEEEAMGIAAGYILAGKKPTVYMQNSGLMRIADIVLSLYKPYNIKLPKLLLSIRHKPEHHSYVGNITHKFLQMIDYDGDIDIFDDGDHKYEKN